MAGIVLVNLVLVHPENNNVVVTDLVLDFDIGSVQCS